MRKRIPMEPAAKYIAEIDSGKIKRYGAILKRVSDGQIVDHLEEVSGVVGPLKAVGGLGRFYSFVPDLLQATNPLLNIAMNAVGLGIEFSNREKLNEIQNVLDVMQITTSAGALISLMDLGISTNGFSVVGKKLDRIESRLERAVSGIEYVHQLLEHNRDDKKAMAIGKLMSAADYLSKAERARRKKKRVRMAETAEEKFTELKNYYSASLCKEGLFSNVKIPLKEIDVLLTRYSFCCAGLLHAELLTGDMEGYRAEISILAKEYEQVATFNPKKVYIARCNQLGSLAIDAGYKDMANELRRLSSYTRESLERIRSLAVELDYIESYGLTLAEYLDEIKRAEPDLMVVLPAQEPKDG